METKKPCPICFGTGKVRVKTNSEKRIEDFICRACLGKGIYDEELLRRWREYEYLIKTRRYQSFLKGRG